MDVDQLVFNMDSSRHWHINYCNESAILSDISIILTIEFYTDLRKGTIEIICLYCFNYCFTIIINHILGINFLYENIYVFMMLNNFLKLVPLDI